MRKAEVLEHVTYKVRQLLQAADELIPKCQQHRLQLQARSAGNTHRTRQAGFPLANHQRHGVFCKSAGQGSLLPFTRIIYCNPVKDFLKTVKARAHSRLGWC